MALGQATVSLYKQLNIQDPFYKIPDILKIFGAIKQQERENVSKATAYLCERLKITSVFKIKNFLEAFGAIEEQERTSISEATAHLCERLEITEVWQIKHVLNAFGTIEQQGQASVGQATVSLYKQLNIQDTFYEIPDILKIFGAIKQQERENVSQATAYLCEHLKITSCFKIKDVLQAFGAIEEQERKSISEATAHLCKRLDITEVSQIKAVLNAFGAIEQQERASISQATADLCKRLNIGDTSAIFVIVQSLQRFPPELRDRVCGVIRSIRQVPSNANLLIGSILERSPDLRQPLHDYLLQLLDFTLNPLATTQLAQDICRHQNEFCLFLDHPLVQKAIMVVSATVDMTKPTNPYVIYKKCQDANKEGIAGGDPRRYVIEDQKVVLNPAVFQERNNHRITFSMLPLGITWQTFVKLFEDLEQRIQGLDTEAAKEVKAHIENAFLQSFAFLKQNMSPDDYLRKFLRAQGNPNDPALLQQAYLLCLIQHIQNLPNEREAQQLLSQREDALLAFSSSIQACAIGKAEGIALAYNQLPSGGKLSLAQESGNPTVEKALKQLDEIVFTILMDQCSSDNSMMHALTGEPEAEIKQLAHQTLYVKNMIARWIGLPHSVQFDPHTHYLYDPLIKKTLTELLDIFYEHLPVQRFIDALVDRSRQDKELFPLLTALLEEKLGKQLDCADFAVLWEVDDDSNPLNLTKTGALQVWEAAGFISKIE